MRTFKIVVAVIILATGWSLTLGQESQQLTAAEVRQIIADGNIQWGKARVDFDTLTFDKMLAPDFYVDIWGRMLTRQEFLKSISFQSPERKLTRFDATVLTVQPKDDEWVAIIQEKLKHETPKGKIYAMWITRDGWKQADGKWIITFSEAIGRENWWEGVKPPFIDW